MAFYEPCSIDGLARQQTERGCPLSRLFQQFLVGVIVECADIANLAPIYDQAEYFCFAEGRRRHR